MTELANAVQDPQTTGGDASNLLTPMFVHESKTPETIFSNLFGKDTTEAEHEQILFKTLIKFPTLRKSLPSINSARAFKYGSRSFGKKRWYRETFDVVSGLKSNADRRKFRFGLKSNVDFLIQLDLESLKTCLLDKSFEPRTSATSGTNPLSDGSFLDTMRQMDYTRFKKFCTLLNRIQANLHFTQSLSEYFATDDMLEPALMVVSDAIRRNLDLEISLRGGSVAANALTYRHRASPRDREFSSRRPPHQESRAQSYRSKSSNFSSRKTHVSEAPKYPIGSCWYFQATGVCNKTDCEYDHACCKCHSKLHGKDSCPDKH